MNESMKILIADDHALIRNGLRQVLEERPNTVILEAENGKVALDLIIKEKPQMAILDIEMPFMTGFDVAKQVHQQNLNIDVVFLTMFKDEAIFNKAMDIGVKGYVLKENTVSEILKCIDVVFKGKYYLSPEISDFLVRRNTQVLSPASDRKGMDQLTAAEKGILDQVAEMKTNQEIAETLNISIKTVQNHRNNICNKLNISGTHALLKFALENTEGHGL